MDLTKKAIESLEPYLINTFGFQGEYSEVVGMRFCSDNIQEVIAKYWQITLPCGTAHIYPLNQFPETDTPCQCGDPTHWVVKYIELEK